MRKPFKPATSKQRDVLRNLENGHAMVWASLSLTAYLVAFILAILLGVPGPLPFFYGGLALFLILVIEASLRGKLWIFEPTFKEAFSHPQVAHRLTYFSIGLLLILESGLLIGYLLVN